MYAYIGRNLRHPHIDAEGRVFVEFVVEADGQVTEVKLKKGVAKVLDDEALRLVSSFPKWEPGKLEGKPCRVRYTLPILFRR